MPPRGQRSNYEMSQRASTQSHEHTWVVELTGTALRYPEFTAGASTTLTQLIPGFRDLDPAPIETPPTVHRIATRRPPIYQYRPLSLSLSLSYPSIPLVVTTLSPLLTQHLPDEPRNFPSVRRIQWNTSHRRNPEPPTTILPSPISPILVLRRR